MNQVRFLGIANNIVVFISSEGKNGHRIDERLIPSRSIGKKDVFDRIYAACFPILFYPQRVACTVDRDDEIGRIVRIADQGYIRRRDAGPHPDRICPVYVGNRILSAAPIEQIYLVPAVINKGIVSSAPIENIVSQPPLDVVIPSETFEIVVGVDVFRSCQVVITVRS